MLSFVTGNPKKFRELSLIFPELQQVDLDLPEIQSLDPEAIIATKLEAAAAQIQGALIVEDTSLSLDCLNGLPGPQIKWFLERLGNQGLFELTDHYRDYRATALTMIGYRSEKGLTRYFSGSMRGQLVQPSTEPSFGWDPIFQPDGQARRLSELSAAEKTAISMRGIAGRALHDYLYA